MYNSSQQTLFYEVLSKPEKTLDDAHFIYDIIRKLPFYENFWNQHLKSIDILELLALCQGCQYERIPKGKFVFRDGEESANKFFVLLSGQAGVIIGKADNDPKQKGGKKQKKKILASLPTTPEVSRARPSIVAQRTVTVNFSFIEEFSPVAASNKLGRKDSGDSWSPITKIQRKSQVKTREIPEDYFQFRLQSLSTFEGEDELITNYSDDDKLQESAKKFGYESKIVKEGHCLGYLTFQNNDGLKALAGICQTDCEFLTLTKEQFDDILLKKGSEKEMFLKQVFPFLATVVLSSTAFNQLLYSFKTEVFTKGQFLTVEGKSTVPNPKLFVIHHGQCRVEKSHMIPVHNPYDRSKVLLTNTEYAQIAIVGQGMLVGEEILSTGDEYKYSVKALSDNVLVYSISQSDFTSGYMKEIQKSIVDSFQKKKIQRDLIFENAKKDLDAKLVQYQAENAYFLKNNQMSHLIKKSSVQKLSRYLNREQHFAKEQEHPTKKLIRVKKNSQTLITNSTQMLDQSHEERGRFAIEDEFNGRHISSIKKENKRTMRSSAGFMNLSKPNTSFSQKVTATPKRADRNEDLKHLESLKFFAEEDPRKVRLLEVLKTKIASDLLNIKPFPNASKTPVPQQSKTPGGSIIKEYAKGAQKYHKKSQELFDIRNTFEMKNLAIETQYSPEPQSPVSKKTGRRSVSPTKSSSPLKFKPTYQIRRPITASNATVKSLSRLGNFPNTETHSLSRIPQFTEKSSRNISPVPFAKGKGLDFEEPVSSNSKGTPQAIFDRLQSVPLRDGDDPEDTRFCVSTVEGSPVNAQSRESYSPTVQSRSSLSPTTRLVRKVSASNSQLRKMQEWRKKVFQKVPMPKKNDGKVSLVNVSLVPMPVEDDTRG